MKNILIIYKVLADITKNQLQVLVDGCKSKKHNVTIEFHDFTLKKEIKSYVQNLEISDIVKVACVDEDYEDRKTSDKVVISKLIAYANFDAVSILVHDIILNNAIDTIDFDMFQKNELLGSIYFDNDVSQPTHTRMYNKSHPFITGSIRALFMPMNKIIGAIGQENPINYVYSKSLSYHLPKSLISINNT